MLIRPDRFGNINMSEETSRARTQQASDKIRQGSSPFEKILSESVGRADAVTPVEAPGLPEAPAPLPVLPVPSEKNTSADFKRALSVVMKHEGSSTVRRDAGRGSSRFGILQSTAREYGYTGDVADMTRPEAEAVYRKIWEKSGASSLPPPLSLVHFDTYVNSPNAARKFLARSGGDIDAYLRLREQRYKRLAEARPAMYARYSRGWANRISSLKGVVTEYSVARNLPGPDAVAEAPGNRLI